MMFRKDDYRYGESRGLKSQIVEVPYQGDQLSMIVILPLERTGLNEVKSLLSESAVEEAINSMWEERELPVTLPKFKLEAGYSLVEPLKKMGLKSPFDRSADLS